MERFEFMVKARVVDNSCQREEIGYFLYKDGKSYITNIYGECLEVEWCSVCPNTNIEIDGYKAFRGDLITYKEPMNDRAYFGYLCFDNLRKRYVLITNSETFSKRELDKCCSMRYTGRNIVTNKSDLEWFEQYSKKELKRTENYKIDNSYCPSKFRR